VGTRTPEQETGGIDVADEPSLTFDEQGYVRMDALADADPDQVLASADLARLQERLHQDPLPQELEDDWDQFLDRATDATIDGADLRDLLPDDSLLDAAGDGPIVLVPDGVAGNGSHANADSTGFTFDEVADVGDDRSPTAGDSPETTGLEDNRVEPFDPGHDDGALAWSDQPPFDDELASPFDEPDGLLDVDVVEIDDQTE
jgi:hypothetical protein